MNVQEASAWWASVALVERRVGARPAIGGFSSAAVEGQQGRSRGGDQMEVVVKKWR